MSENLIICFLAAWSLLAILFLAEGAYYALRWLFCIERDGDPIENHAEKPNGL